MRVSASIELLWQLAGQEAIAGEFREIEPEHFLAAVLKLAELPVEDLGNFAPGANVTRELAAEVDAVRQELQSRSIDSTHARRALRARLGKGSDSYDGGKKHRSQASKDLFDAASRLADEANADVLAPVHLLQTLLAAPTPVMQDVLGDALGSKPPERSETPLLDECGKDLMQMARDGQLADGTDRPAECKALVRLLADPQRRSVVMVTDNNHTGRSTVIEAVHAISKAQCPTELRDKRIVDVTSSKLTTHEAMSQLGKIWREAGGAEEVILFVPSLEASHADQPSHWAEFLKRGLSSLSIQCVFCATPEAYKWVEKQGDMKRRLQAMWVKEPSADSIPWEL